MNTVALAIAAVVIAILVLIDIRHAVHRERTAHMRICGHEAHERDEHERGGP